MDNRTLAAVQTIWDYMHMGMEPEAADCIVGFGCYDEDISRRAAQLYRQGLAPWVLFSGGFGRNTAGLWQTPEAERFAAIAEAEGVPEAAILVENRSTNSAENLIFTRQLLEERGIRVKRILAVHKPYMERRLYAAMRVYWPEVEAIYTSPQMTVTEHIRRAEALGMPERDIIETIAGDLQRMTLYAQKGYQIPQNVPDCAAKAYHFLVESGYTGQLAKE